MRIKRHSNFFLLLFATLFSANVYAAQFTFGVRGGFNLEGMSEKYDQGGAAVSSLKLKFKPGFQVGIVGNLDISEPFAIQSSILFATQGARLKEDFSKTDWNGTHLRHYSSMSMNLYYLQIPINAMYKFDIGKGRFFIQGGPYFGFAISGNAKFEEKFSGEKIDIKIDFGSEYEQMNRFDFGLGVCAGVIFGNFQLGLGYNQGLINLSNAPYTTTKNNGIALTATYLFRK